MKILYGYRNLRDKLNNPIAAIGMFDGIHIGHRRVISKLFCQKDRSSEKVVITFDPHPQVTLEPKKVPPRIMSLEHRLSVFENMGIDTVIVIRFTDAIASMAPEDFVKTVIRGMGIKKVLVGSNFRFGQGKTGNVSAFRDIAAKEGISVEVVRPVRKNRRIVSSTWLRKLITSGKIRMAQKLLRRPVSILGRVVKGEGVGKIINIPTANIEACQEVIPPPGVYAVKVDIGRKLYDGVLNIGFKPTFYGKKLKKRKEPRIEVHITNFKGDLYGHFIEIFFIVRLRSEKHFRNIEKLKTQIKRDIARAEKVAHGVKN